MQHFKLRTVLILAFLIAGTNLASAGTININASGNPLSCDSAVSFSEAIRIGLGMEINSGRTILTNGERNQITGATFAAAGPACDASPGWVVLTGVGSSFADDILVTNNNATAAPTHVGQNDDIDGIKPNGSKLVVSGSGSPAGTNCIEMSLESGSQIRNMVLENCPGSGIWAQAAIGAIFEGLEIRNNGGDGISMGFSATLSKNSRNVRIGGDQPQHRNLIYSNGGSGVLIAASATQDRGVQNINILNNYLGTSNGTSDNGNSINGVYLSNTIGVYVGDPTGATRNVISGNNNDGVNITGSGAVSNNVVGNFIGVDISGGVALGNGASGVALLAGAGATVNFINTSPNKIGLPGLGNVISANNFGVFIADNNTSNNWVQANAIGTNLSANSDVGNGADGVILGGGTFDNKIGGSGASEGNLIAFNRAGINGDGGIRNRFQRNRIFGNDNLGIDLGTVGVTPNDPGDPDTGANNLQNFPVITSFSAQNSSTNVQGTFNSSANQTFMLEFFGNTAVDASGFGEGRNYLGITSVTTDASGNATFDSTFSVNIATTGTFITATATDSLGNTSEFSQARNKCADMTLSPTSTSIGAAGGAGNFTVINSVGCTYTATSNAPWITIGSTPMGTVNFTVAATVGGGRSGTITVSYNNGTSTSTRTFTVNQSSGCTFSISPTGANVAPFSGSGTYQLDASDETCSWTLTSNQAWLTTFFSSGTGDAVVVYLYSANTGAARTGTITVGGQIFTVNQSASTCTYSLNPTSQSVPIGGGNSSFSLNTAAGCHWAGTSNASWITILAGSGGTGPATIFYQTAANSGAARSGVITVGGQNFTVNQTGTCTYSLAPASVSVNAIAGSFTYNLTASHPACTWFSVESSSWVTLGNSTGTGNGTVTFNYLANTGASRTATINTAGVIFTLNQAGTSVAPFDFDGDGKTDVSIFRPSNGQWWYTRSIDGGNSAVTFGQSTDKIMPADFTGDGKTDVAFWRPSTNEWYVVRSENFTFYAFPFGASGDIPLPADYDGDGKADAAIFRPSTATWYVSRSSGGTTIQQFGQSTDIPVRGDFDGDGKSDLAIFRPLNGQWWILRSSTGASSTYTFGTSTDKLVPGDYTGDGKTDVAFWRPSTREWFVLRSEDLSFYAVPFGLSTDVPVPGDYDGDGTWDTAVLRPSANTWYVNRSTAGILIVPFGLAGDKPVPGAFIP